MTCKHLVIPIIATLGLALSAGAGVGQDATGKVEFMAACASCHGEMGKGDGDIAKFLNVEVPDLTQLAANNDGTFPMGDVIYIIDGRTGVRGHATQMPMWGDFFAERLGGGAGAYGAETLVRGRILALAYYLESIQQ